MCATHQANLSLQVRLYAVKLFVIACKYFQNLYFI